MSRPGGKAGVGLLSLKWNNYKSIFFESINTLRDQSKYTDATLAVEGHFYHVHKLVMSTCSEYFSNIFEKTPCKAPVIVLKDVTRDEIEGLLSYMYLGEVNVHQQDIASFLKTAESLKIKGLAVSDEEPTNLSKSQSSSRKDASRDSPSVKKRRMENNGSSTAVPPVKAFKKSDNPLINMKVEMNSPEISKTKLNKPPMVKIGMSDAEERDRRIRTNINYEEDPGSDTQDTGDVYGPDSPMTDQAPEPESPEHETENEPSTSFFGGALQQSGDAQWEGEDAGSSFIPETYMGNVSTSLKAQGPDRNFRGAITRELNEAAISAPSLAAKHDQRSHFSKIMRICNGGNQFRGYGDITKIPVWWIDSCPWPETSKQREMDSDFFKPLIMSAYEHYGIQHREILDWGRQRVPRNNDAQNQTDETNLQANVEENNDSDC